MAKPSQKPKKPILAEKRNGKGTMVHASELNEERVIGAEGWEGVVRSGFFTVKKKGRDGKERERTVNLAEKVFKLGGGPRTYKIPEEQLKVVNELRELNRKKKLGLRLPPTVRLLRREGRPWEKPTLLVTKYERTLESGLMTWGELNEKQRADFEKDRARQIAILEREGYMTFETWDNLIKPYVDPKTKNCVALLLDFGGLVKRGR